MYLIIDNFVTIYNSASFFTFHTFDNLRQNHARKSVKSSDFQAVALEFTYKIAKKWTVICSFASHVLFISFATSRSQIFSAKMSSQFVSLKDSHLLITTSKNTSKSMKKLLTNCFLNFSLSLYRISVRNLHEFHIQKSHFKFIMNDLSRMFDEKSWLFSLQQHQNRRFSSQDFDLRQSSQSCFSISKKLYFIMNDLSRMFDEKFRKKSMFQNQKNVSFIEFFSKQSRITVYFKFTVNQKSSIIQIVRCFLSSEVFEVSYFCRNFFLHFYISSFFFDLSHCFRVRFNLVSCKIKLH